MLEDVGQVRSASEFNVTGDTRNAKLARRWCAEIKAAQEIGRAHV